MAMTDELWRRSAVELAELIRSGDVSSREVIQAHLDRIDAVNPAINAITVVLADDALAAADEADRSPGAGAFHGVPFTVKENLDLVGSPTTNGVPAMLQAFPSEDAPAVRLMKAAGGIPLARTNLPEMGLRIATDNPLRGRTNNPWNRDLGAGGSSGGEGAAIAVGMSPFGLGNDIGGSVRNPAFCCGVAALKPTHGRIAHAVSIPPLDPAVAVQLMLSDGPMARTVADLRYGMQVLNGRDPRDPRSVDVPFDGPAPHTKAVALVTDLSMPSPFVDAVRAAGSALEGAGWKVLETSPPDIERVNEVWVAILKAGLGPFVPLLAQVMSPPALNFIERLVGMDAPDLVTAHTERHRLQREWSAFFADYPVVIGPTWCDVQLEHDADIHPDTGVEAMLSRLPFITPGNLLGIPSCAVPTGVSNGLPTGVQVYADLWRDDLALDAAELIERELGVITPIDPR